MSRPPSTGLPEKTTKGPEDDSPFRSMHQGEINIDLKTQRKSKLPPKSEFRSPFERTKTLGVPGVSDTYEKTSKGEFPTKNMTGSFLNSPGDHTPINNSPISKRDTSPEMLQYKSRRNNDSEGENSSKFDHKYIGKSQ